MSRDGDFLSRWARRKAEVREAEAVEAEKKAALTPDGGSGDHADGGQEPDDKDRPATEEEIAALPDPDSLEHGADFKPFLRSGIPAALRQRALRRLWRVNPAIGFLDGMNEYDLDYTDAATVVENLKTAYQVGRGFVVPEEEEAPAKVPAETTAKDAPAVAGDSPTAEANAEECRETARPEPGGEEVSALSPTGAAQQSADETPDSLQNNVESDAAAQSAVTNLTTQASEPGQAAARRWARFSTAIER